MTVSQEKTSNSNNSLEKVHHYQDVPIVNRAEQTAPATYSRGWILVLGQDQLTPKAFYYAKEFEKYGVKTFFFSQDKSGLSAENITKYSLHASTVPSNLLKHWFEFLKLLIKLRPLHSEIFTGVRPWTLFVYVIFLRLMRIPIIPWCRGRRSLDVKNQHLIRRLVNRFLFYSAKRILLRELHMPETFRQLRLAKPEKLRLCYNSVPIPPEAPAHHEQLVLFLNSFIRWRYPMLVVETAAIVLKEIPSARFELVGATSHLPNYNPAPEEVEYAVRARIEELGLADRVAVLPFTENPQKYFHRASIFLLPAEIVFCNHSLLEAMAMEVVPIVSQSEGSELIIEDGKSGYIVQRDPSQFADRIIRLFRDKPLIGAMAKAAKKQVRKNYNIENTAASLLQLYQQEIWPEPRPT